MQYSKDLARARVLKGDASLLGAATATTLRPKAGKITTTDGPFIETKEQLGGNYLIDVPDVNHALEWGAKLACCEHGVVEVRPLGIMTDGSSREVIAMQEVPS